jgi:predicted AAA+ superfamily ATPase
MLFQLADDLLDLGWPPANLTYFDFSDDRLATPIAAREVAEMQPAGRDPALPQVLLFDEIHLGNHWDRWLKQAVDQGGTRVVGTDSAAHLIRAASSESGQGRWDELRLEGLSLREFARFFSGGEEEPGEVLLRTPNLDERYLSLGGFPEHVLSEDFPEVRRKLRSDIADRAILRDLAGLGVDVVRIKALFLYLVQDSGEIFNAKARASDLEADERSVREWARLLEETMLIVRLPSWVRHPAAGLRSKSKLFAADPGLVAAFASTPIGEVPVRGRLFEAAVFRHLREAARQLGAELTYFREREDLEIDFVVSTAAGLTAIEVTSSRGVRPEKIERVRRVGKALGAEHLLLIYGGVVDQVAGGVRAVALARFLLDPVGVLKGSEDGSADSSR